ncbi:hypothetical protein HPB47_020056 [Ixodes persulcatus]|uniref:Uncharacterized protein n=1 Tax=Ixodes persulcatus TaxID=34615 RepID=A0AC60QJ11_IXOPE|nr:hypothetical protein HPB47_020056 [Ixodes persulcatus]
METTKWFLMPWEIPRLVSNRNGYADRPASPGPASRISGRGVDRLVTADPLMSRRPVYSRSRAAGARGANDIFGPTVFFASPPLEALLRGSGQKGRGRPCCCRLSFGRGGEIGRAVEPFQVWPPRNHLGHALREDALLRPLTRRIHVGDGPDLRAARRRPTLLPWPVVDPGPTLGAPAPANGVSTTRRQVFSTRPCVGDVMGGCDVDDG